MKKTILITGANRGIGFEIARQLGRLGHAVILAARDEEKLALSVQKLKEDQWDAEGLLMDVGEEKSIHRAAASFARRNLKLDVLINNAAVLFGHDKQMLQENDEMLQLVLATNSLGPLRICRAFLPFMKSPGRVINLSSGGGSMSDPVGGWAPAYCVSKTLLNSITRQMAYELESKNISVNAVCPGWVNTRMGGRSAPRPVEKGAETPVWLATEAPQELSGKFFRDRKEIPW